MSRLVLVDGNAILHRAYHALPKMTNSKGQETNAVYGFISMLITTMNQLNPTHLVVAFDRPAPTFRKKLFTAYQSQRPEMESQLVGQIALVHKALEAMGVSIYELDGYEADDVIGTLAKQAVERSKIKDQKSKSDIEVVIVTGDRDLLQLVNERVKLFMPVKGLSEAKLYGEKEAEERMGVPPRLIDDLKGWMGDPSDNYPGVSGIGPKTAATLLKEFGSVENIYKNLHKIKNQTIVAKLTKDKENALLSHKLATVVCDAPVALNISKAQLGELVNQQVLNVFAQLEFKTLLKRLLKLQSGSTEEKTTSKKEKASDD